MNEITIFSNAEFGQIRTLTGSLTPHPSPLSEENPNGDIWFVGKDVAALLGYANTMDALAKHVDNEDKQTSQIAMGGQRYNMTIINESGLYSLIVPEASFTSNTVRRRHPRLTCKFLAKEFLTFPAKLSLF